MDIQVLELKRGKPLLLGEELDKRVQEYIKSLQKCGAGINTHIVMAGAEGIMIVTYILPMGGILFVGSIGPKLNGFCQEKGEYLKCLWQILRLYKSQFLSDINALVEMEEIPTAAIINWDHTGIKYVPIGGWMAVYP